MLSMFGMEAKGREIVLYFVLLAIMFVVGANLMSISELFETHLENEVIVPNERKRQWAV